MRNLLRTLGLVRRPGMLYLPLSFYLFVGAVIYTVGLFAAMVWPAECGDCAGAGGRF